MSNNNNSTASGAFNYGGGYREGLIAAATTVTAQKAAAAEQNQQLNPQQQENELQQQQQYEQQLLASATAGVYMQYEQRQQYEQQQFKPVSPAQESLPARVENFLLLSLYIFESPAWRSFIKIQKTIEMPAPVENEDLVSNHQGEGNRAHVQNIDFQLLDDYDLPIASDKWNNLKHSVDYNNDKPGNSSRTIQQRAITVLQQYFHFSSGTKGLSSLRAVSSYA